MVEQHLVGLTILDADVKRNVARHFSLHKCDAGNGVARDAEAIDERDAVVSLEGRVAFRLAIASIAPLNLTVVAVAIDDVCGSERKGEKEEQ
jgi:hypothetical protein